MTNTTPPVQVPDSIRVPLDSLHADAEYLLARLLAGTLTREQVVGVIRDRIDAAQLEIESLKARLEPAGEYPPLPEPLVLEQGYDPGDMPDAYTADQMRAYVDADRAMRAQAAPAAVAVPEPERSKPRRFLSWACPVCCASVETTP